MQPAGVMSGVKQGILVLYPWLSTMLPPLRAIPIDAVVGVIDAIEAGHQYKLKLDLNVRDWRALMRMFKEVGEAGVINTETERRQAIYAMLVYATNIEDCMTLDEFMAVDVM